MGAVPDTRPSIVRRALDDWRVPIGCAVESRVEQDAIAGGGIGRARAQRVEDGARGLFGRDRRRQAAGLELRREEEAGRAPRLGAVIVGGGDEPDLETVLEVQVAEPLEGPVHRADLDQALGVAVAAVPVGGVVRVRDDQHVVGAVLAQKPRVERVEHRRLLARHALGPVVAEEDVVVAADLAAGAPLVAEERDELAVLVVTAARLVDGPPLPVVHRGVVIGERHEVEPRIVARVAEVLIGGALALGVAGMAVQLAPVDAPVGTRFDPDRVRDRRQLAVGRARLEPVGAGFGEAKTLGDGDSIVAARSLATTSPPTVSS